MDDYEEDIGTKNRREINRLNKVIEELIFRVERIELNSKKNKESKEIKEIKLQSRRQKECIKQMASALYVIRKIQLKSYEKVFDSKLELELIDIVMKIPVVQGSKSMEMIKAIHDFTEKNPCDDHAAFLALQKVTENLKEYEYE